MRDIYMMHIMIYTYHRIRTTQSLSLVLSWISICFTVINCEHEHMQK